MHEISWVFQEIVHLRLTELVTHVIANRDKCLHAFALTINNDILIIVLIFIYLTWYVNQCNRYVYNTLFPRQLVFFLSSLQTTQEKSLFILTICVKHYECALELKTIIYHFFVFWWHGTSLQLMCMYMRNTL